MLSHMIWYIKKTQNVDGSTVYDASDVAFNTSDKSSIPQTNNIDIIQSVNNKAMTSDVYDKTVVDIGLNRKSYKFNT